MKSKSRGDSAVADADEWPWAGRRGGVRSPGPHAGGRSLMAYTRGGEQPELVPTL
jgi:hypothetical protein